jgi:hypothetical protein
MIKKSLRSDFRRASDMKFLVELRGFEPLTPSMRRRNKLWPVVAGRGSI